jgi:hypothetical protein
MCSRINMQQQGRTAATLGGCTRSIQTGALLDSEGKQCPACKPLCLLPCLQEGVFGINCVSC